MIARIKVVVFLKSLKTVIFFLTGRTGIIAKVLIGLTNSAKNIRIDPGALGFYLGYIVGFVASEVVIFFLTGGTGTIAKVLKETLRSYKAFIQMPLKAGRLVGKTVKFGIDTFTRLIDVVADFIKNIPKHIDTLKGWIDEFIESLSKITRVFSDDVYKLYEKLGVTIKKVPQQPVLASGIPVPVGDNLYALVREGKEVFRGSKKEVEELAEKLKSLDEAEAKKYLDELNRKSEIHLLEHWDDIRVSGRGRRSGQRLNKSDVRYLKEKLNNLGVDLELHSLNSSDPIKGFFIQKDIPARMPKGAAAIFITDGSKMTIVLRKGATIYEFFHEFMHFRHAKSLGLKKYLAMGGRNTIGELVKEQWVFDKLIENFKFLTQKEIQHAWSYLNKRVYPKFGKEPKPLGFDVKEIPEIRKEIKMSEIMNIK